MGYLRILLASLVLASHINVIPGVMGSIAVECFYIISGFYIQMILAERYTKQPQWRRKFYESRILRIFVPYWAVMLGIILLTAIFHPHTLFEHLPGLSNPSGLAVFANIFIIPSEHIELVRIAKGCTYPPFLQLVIPQIWSVGLELLFYIVAPWILLMRTGVLASIVLLCLVGKAIMIYSAQDMPFTVECSTALLNNIFPLEMGIFLIGALVYRFYRTQMHLRINYTMMIGMVSAATAMLLVFYDNNPILAWYGYLFCIVLLLPFLFQASKTLKRDRLIGELSYPFYLCHYCIARDFLAHIMGNRMIIRHPSLLYVKFIILELAVLLCAWGILKYIIEPVDAYRHRKFVPID